MLQTGPQPVRAPPQLVSENPWELFCGPCCTGPGMPRDEALRDQLYTCQSALLQLMLPGFLDLIRSLDQSQNYYIGGTSGFNLHLTSRGFPPFLTDDLDLRFEDKRLPAQLGPALAGVAQQVLEQHGQGILDHCSCRLASTAVVADVDPWGVRVRLQGGILCPSSETVKWKIADVSHKWEQQHRDMVSRAWLRTVDVASHPSLLGQRPVVVKVAALEDYANDLSKLDRWQQHKIPRRARVRALGLMTGLLPGSPGGATPNNLTRMATVQSAEQVYRAPTLFHPVHSLKRGEQVEVLPETVPNGFVRIRTQAGLVGYVKGQSLRSLTLQQATVYRTDGNVTTNLREVPTTQQSGWLPVPVRVRQNEVVEVVQQGPPGFLRVRCSSGEGYLRSEHVK